MPLSSDTATERAFSALRTAFSNLADFVGRVSIGRLVLLCFLMLIAAEQLDDFFLSGKRAKLPVVQVEELASDTSASLPAPEPSSDAALPNPPAPPAPSGAPASKQVEIRIGEKTIVVSGSKDLAKLGKRIEQEIEAQAERSRRITLPDVVILFIVVMFIIRIVGKSKAKADAKVAQSAEVAKHAALEQQLAEAKLQAMQAQVEPHFLFNTLAAVEHLIETDPPRAAAMQRNLIAYLRSVLPNLRRSDSTLGREAEIARNYLEILKFRMEDRLEFQINIPAGIETAAMPPLMLQSLVENAIQHGLEPTLEGGRIDISAAIHDGQVRVAVADTGGGFDPSGQNHSAGSGVGLASIRERLKALFGAQGRLLIEPNSPRGTRTTLEFPYAYKQSTPSADRGR